MQTIENSASDNLVPVLLPFMSYSSVIRSLTAFATDSPDNPHLIPCKVGVILQRNGSDKPESFIIDVTPEPHAPGDGVTIKVLDPVADLSGERATIAVLCIPSERAYMLTKKKKKKNNKKRKNRKK